MKDIEPVLRSLVREHGMPLKKLGVGLGVTSADILRWNNREPIKFSFSQIKSLSHYLGVSQAELESGIFDGKLIRRRIHEGPLTLPEKYSRNPGSRVRTSAHIIDFLKLYYGQGYCDNLLLSMNIHPCYFDDLDNVISFQFFVDLLEKLQDLNYGLEEIQSLARLLPVFLKGSLLGNALGNTGSYEELFYVLMSNFAKFDLNFDYRAEISAEGAFFEATPSERTKAHWPTRGHLKYELEEIFFYREGWLSNFSYLQGQHHLEVTPVKAIFDGDDVDRYWIEFPQHFMPRGDRLASSI